jgi:serine protein kinase
MSDLFKALEAEQNAFRQEVLTLKEYLELCKVDGMGYASAAERMLNAIGEPELVNTHADPRLSRIFSNRTIRRYPAFNDFYGMEDSVERIVGYFKHSAQGLEEKKQILYLLGPVGGGKSSLAERLKELIQKCPIYVLADKDGNMSPVFETPLGLFGRAEFGAILEKEYNIPQRYLTDVMSPWAVKRLKDYNGDKTKFKVVKVYPSKLEQLGVIKTEPGDDNNQDISNLVGKTNIRMLEHFDQNDPDSYSFSGALCRGNQGLVEFVEMFKAPIKMLHPLLTATQEGNYVGTEGISAIPFNGIVLAHSNESEWQTFKNNKNNEAFI